MKQFLRTVCGPFYSMLFTMPKIASAPAYFKDVTRKPWMRRYFEILLERLVTRSTNHFYNAYGLDRKGCSWREAYSYMSEREWWSRVCARNYKERSNSSVCLRNKLMFDIFCKGASLPTPAVFAYAINDRYFVSSNRGGGASLDEFKTCLKGHLPFFLKGVTGCCARSVFKVTSLEDIDRLLAVEQVVICQESLTQHEALNRLNPSSINTIRIITIKTKDGQVVLPFEPLLRIGASEAPVDNWAVGGLVVRIDDGALDDFGYYKATLPKEQYCVTQHPISGVSFASYEIPYYQEAVELVKRAHTLLSDLFVIGWDVAITPTGPVLIEGNDDPELTLHQIVCRRGLRTDLRKYL